MDAISLLKSDHKTVAQLFKRFEKASPRAMAEKRELMDRIIEELSVHAAIEEQLFYPVVRATVPGSEQETLESLEEHHIVKWVLSELDGLDPEDERFTAKATVLIENVRHHVDEEEGKLFPMVRDELGRHALNVLGDALEEARAIAPTHPHPRTPDTPPANLALGTAAAVADRIGDTLSGLAQGSVTAVQDVIATVMGRKKPASRPRGSSVARRTASRTRARASEVSERAIRATRQAKETGERATHRAQKSGKAAARGTKRTATAARKGATATARTARTATKSTARTARAGAKSTARAAAARPTRATSAAKRGPVAKRGPARKSTSRTAATRRTAAKR